MNTTNKRIEVMHFLAQKIDSIIDEFLKSIDTNWQPADFLPDSSTENFEKEVRELQGTAIRLFSCISG
jgi:acyl-[acyl-carrier-protein] desaturase